MNLMELFVKIGADMSGLDSGMSEAENKAFKFGQSIGNGLKTAAKVGAAAVGAASTAVATLTKNAVSSYADYEQLAGGVETLFGTSAKKVIADADAAFKTAGMSANQYMETSIQSAAALINSLGGDQAKAAEMMNMSITDMSDNVNKMGTSMEAVQNAYRGFSRGNFTMLDNLALGFAGTKEGMQELINKAQELSGIEYDISSYSDIVEAIHVVQTEMGITGTTAKEASGTISGSLGALKSAWDNLVTGIADPNADLGQLIDNVIGSAETTAENLIPIIEKSLTGIADLVAKLAPIIADKLPGLVNDLLPPILSAAVQLVNSIVESLPSILQVLIDQVPMLIDTIVPTFIDLLPQIVELGVQLILAIALGISEALPELVPAIVDVIIQITEILLNNLDQIILAAVQIIIALIEGLVNATPQLIAKIPEIILKVAEAIIKSLPVILQAGIELVMELIRGIVETFGSLEQTGRDTVDAVKNGFWEYIEQAKQWGADLIDNFIGGIKSRWESLRASVSSVAQTVKDLIGFSEPKEGPLSNFHTYAPDMMDLFAQGIKDGEKDVRSQIESTFDFGNIVTTPALAGVPSGTTTAQPDVVSALTDALGNVTLQVLIGGKQ